MKKRNSKTPPSASDTTQSIVTPHDGQVQSSPESATSGMLSFNSKEKSPLADAKKLSREAENFESVFSSEIQPDFNEIGNLNGNRLSIMSKINFILNIIYFCCVYEL